LGGNQTGLRAETPLPKSKKNKRDRKWKKKGGSKKKQRVDNILVKKMNTKKAKRNARRKRKGDFESKVRKFDRKKGKKRGKEPFPIGKRVERQKHLEKPPGQRCHKKTSSGKRDISKGKGDAGKKNFLESGWKKSTAPRAGVSDFFMGSKEKTSSTGGREKPLGKRNRMA